jgi:alpha-beta hydrolase superfamily lysophospholipase
VRDLKNNNKEAAMSLKTIAFTSGDSGDCYYHQWSPQPSVQPKAWVHIMHGMAEHSARYQHLAEFLNQQGYRVSADDHRGHGKTGDTSDSLFHLADNNGWNQMLDDQWQLIEHIAEQSELPLIILGHSMGSFMATHFCQIYADKFQDRFGKRLKGLVLSGSNYAPPWTCRMAASIARLERLRLGKRSVSTLLETLSFGAFNNAFKPNRTAKDWISSHQEAVDTYLADPYCGGAISTQSWYDFLKGLETLSRPKAMATISSDLPIYLFSGELDPVGGQGKGVEKLVAVLRDAGVKNIACKLYKEGRHEMLNEVNRQEVYGDLLDWLDGRLDSYLSS